MEGYEHPFHSFTAWQRFEKISHQFSRVLTYDDAATTTIEWELNGVRLAVNPPLPYPPSSWSFKVEMSHLKL